MAQVVYLDAHLVKWLSSDAEELFKRAAQLPGLTEAGKGDLSTGGPFASIEGHSQWNSATRLYYHMNLIFPRETVESYVESVRLIRSDAKLAKMRLLADAVLPSILEESRPGETHIHAGISLRPAQDNPMVFNDPNEDAQRVLRFFSENIRATDMEWEPSFRVNIESSRVFAMLTAATRMKEDVVKRVSIDMGGGTPFKTLEVRKEEVGASVKVTLRGRSGNPFDVLQSTYETAEKVDWGAIL